MKIALVKHGGFTAGMRQLPLTVEVSTLPEEERIAATQLLAAVQVVSTDQEWKPAGAPDAMSYTITVTADDDATTQFHVSDETMSPSFAALLQWLNRHGARK